jgi:uncharacterized RDD family membrane protein YckC
MTRVSRTPRRVEDARDGAPGSGPVAPPTTHAGVVTRGLAACVDLAAVVLATMVVDLAAAGARFAWSPVTFRWPQPAAPVTVFVLLAVAVVYLAVAWAMTGRTYGARLLGLRVLSTRLTLLGWTRSILRAFAYVILPVGLLWSGISADRRSLQDLVFRTVVVYDSKPYLGNGAAPVRGGRPTRL